MSTQQAQWVPMSELGAQTPSVTWRLNEYLSEYTPTDNLLVNPDRLSRLAMWGSFKPNVVVTGEAAPEAADESDRPTKDHDTPSVNGINADGSAIAGLSLNRRKQPELGRAALTGRIDKDGDVIDPQSDALSCRRVDLALHLDVPAIEATLTEQRSLRDPGAWAAALDTTLRRQTVEATKEHLMGGAITKFMLGAPRAGLMAWALVLSEKFDTPLGWQYAALESLPILAGIAKKTSDMKRNGLHSSDKCYSLFWPQIDRIPATALLARLPMSRIVKPA
ncbi:MAG TPA: hypothetical protein VFI74_03715 [Candidatus Saccharimonadales bacterium]|nr:hypothetical protein [Candidatus Saccharimonadales bacterium]